MKNKYIYPAIFINEVTGGYSVLFPDLKGCQTQGETLEEALSMANEALSLFLYDCEERNVEINAPSTPSEVILESNQFISIIECDMLEYRKKYDNKAVKKTLSIPRWLNTFAEEANVNFSNVLQNALIDTLKLKR